MILLGFFVACGGAFEPIDDQEEGGDAGLALLSIDTLIPDEGSSAGGRRGAAIPAAWGPAAVTAPQAEGKKPSRLESRAEVRKISATGA